MNTRYRDELGGLRADTSLRGMAFCRAYTGAADRWLQELWDAASGDVGEGAALLAVGGYGRGEMCPGSDLDLLLVQPGRRARPDVSRLAERLWYPLWDSGLKLGHAVRTVKEALSLAADDLDSATALLDARVVAGDPAVAADLSKRAADQWRARSSRWLATLAARVAERHASAGEVGFLLEPDLKEGRGGLRDVHALRWAEAARRILLDDDQAALAGAHQTLVEVRVELQRRTGKALDRLLLQDQDAVAEALGDADADVLMGRVAAAARTIAWTSDETWQRIQSSLQGPSGRVAGRDRPVGPGLVVREGLVELAPGQPVDDPSLVLRAAAAAAVAHTRLGRGTLDHLAAGAPGPGDPWPDDARRALVRLLDTGRAAIPVLEALDQKGLLVRVLPEWAPVRSRPQRNAYHRFTVDRHLCEAAAEAAGRAARVRRPDLLVLGAWLHDIGKGYVPELGPDHTAAGVEVVRRVATRMGFPKPDVDVLVAMVAHHLLLPDVATRRDVDDPATAAGVAEAVGDIETLELLHVLTEADSAATGPAAWSQWKAGLVDELVARSRRLLAGEAPERTTESPTQAHLALVAAATAADDGMAVEGDGRVLTVVARDRPGLFWRVAGTLTIHGLDVLSARAWPGEGGMAIEDFLVDPVFGGEPPWEAVAADLRRAVAGRLSLEARVTERARRYLGRSGPASAAPARTAVIVDNDASATATVVEVRAPDRIGTLYRITRALADLELDIRSAKVATLGHEVVDTFYVLDASGERIVDPDHAREVERAVLVELGRIG
ncbi:MAG: [protein-PII] uridylyltransferase [Actinomycetota bacterium]|nr:[protein-PII] uridylyltransferase [Actinomycetota bacterium]